MNAEFFHSPRNRWIGLCAGCLLLALLAYKFSFSQTIALKRQVTVNEGRLKQVKDLPRLIRAYEDLLAESKGPQETRKYDREVLFEEINTFCRNHALQLVHFYPEQKNTIRNFDLITNQLEVQGDFLEMVQLGWAIEREKKLGNIASISYKTMEDKRTGKSWLSGTFFIQHYLPHETAK